MRTIIIRNQENKDYAISLIRELPTDPMHKVEIKKSESIRTLDQNAKMWAMLTDISNQVVWYGKKLSPRVWKDIFSASINGQETVPGLDNNFVVVGRSTSRMTIREMSDIIECCYAFGADPDHPVTWSEPVMYNRGDME